MEGRRCFTLSELLRKRDVKTCGELRDPLSKICVYDDLDLIRKGCDCADARRRFLSHQCQACGRKRPLHLYPVSVHPVVNVEKTLAMNLSDLSGLFHPLIF